MKNGFTLIELIVSMVIIAFVFTVVPKLIFATGKTMETAIKEDGLFAAISKAYEISVLPWDENTHQSGGKILDTDANLCSDYRIGGFVGSRNCIDTALAATPKAGFIETAGVYDDVDDYDGYSNTITNLSGKRSYVITVDVNYTDTALGSVGGTDELKKVNVGVSSTVPRFCSTFFFYSANLGYTQINKRAW